MKSIGRSVLFSCVLGVLFLTANLASAQTTAVPLNFTWQTVVNNGYQVPGDSRKFNSYNQPSVSVNKMVVFRGRSKGGTTGEPAHGIWTRDMKNLTPLETIFDRTTLVPYPNNLDSTFIEPPSFPRIDIFTNTVASRGNHQGVLTLSDGTKVGTTGIYTNPFGSLITGATNLGGLPGLEQFNFFVEPTTGVKFDVFPGAPAVTGGDTIVFKGNYTVDTAGKTGVYYRKLAKAETGGTGPVIVIANSDTKIPGSAVTFGSTAPPSAAPDPDPEAPGINQAVFTGFKDEDHPDQGGGIYRAYLTGANPVLQPMVQIGDPVPGVNGATFNKLGEGLSFDGRFIAYWGAWGDETKKLTLQCPAEGNAERRAYCLETYPNGFDVYVPVNQGIFVIDTTKVKGNRLVARTPNDFDDFVYWNFSGMVTGIGNSDETGEPARWRSASFVAISGMLDGSLINATYHTAFKARKGQIVNGAYDNPIDGIYLRKGPGDSPIYSAVVTGMDGTMIDSGAIDPTTGTVLPVTEMGLERDGFRGNILAINVSMGTEEAGWAGIYLTEISNLPN